MTSSAQEKINNLADKYTNTKVGDVEFPPLRPLDDFLLTQARYQIPPYNDLEKWNNRVCSNMLYYQTNYLLMMLVVFLLVGFIHPQEVITGVLVIASVVGVVAYACSANPDALQFKREHPIVSVGAVAVVCYLLITAIASIVVFLYGLLLPILAMFIHSSLRLRNVSNKLTNVANKLGGLHTKTAMGRVFDALGVDVSMF